MYRILTILFLLLPFISKGQTYPPQKQGAKLYKFMNGLGIDSALFLPRKDTTTPDPTMRAPGMIVYRPQDSILYYRKGDSMVSLTTGARVDSLSLTVENIAALRGTSYNAAPDKKSVYVRGYYTTGDGGGGNFYWSDTATSADNGGTIIKVGSIVTGRWKRIITGDVDFRMFGARGDGVSDDSDPFQRAIDAFQVAGSENSGAHFTLSKGVYPVANVIIRSGTYIDAHQAARDNFIPNVPATIKAFGHPNYILDVDPSATNWALKNLSIDGDFTNQPQLVAAVRLRGAKGYFTDNNVNRCAQAAVWSEAGIIFIERNGIYGWYGSLLPIFSGINDFHGALHVPSFGDAYIRSNEVGAGLNYFTSTVTPRDATNGRIVAMSLGNVFGGTGWISENFFENGDKSVALGNSLYCEFYFNRYELSAIGGLHIYGPAQYIGFTGERFSDNSLTADSAADNIIIGIGAAGQVVFESPIFERLVNGAIPNSGFKSRWGISNYGSVEIDMKTPQIDTSYITGLVNNVDVSSLPVRQVKGQYDPNNPIHNSLTVGNNGNKTPFTAFEFLGGVKLLPGTTTGAGDYVGSLNFFRANGSVHSSLGLNNTADLSFTLYESLGRYIFGNGELLLAKNGDNGITIQSNDGLGDMHINMNTNGKSAGLSLDNTTGDLTQIASGTINFNSGSGSAFTFIGAGIVAAKTGGLDLNLISNNTGISSFKLSSDVLATNLFSMVMNNTNGNTTITSTGSIVLGNGGGGNISIEPNTGLTYMPKTPNPAGVDTSFDFVVRQHTTGLVSIKNNVYWDSTKVKSYVATSSPAAINNVNGMTGPAISIATGTSGTNFNIGNASNTVTLNIPDAGPLARGFMTAIAQSFGGVKTFNDGVIFPANGTPAVGKVPTGTDGVGNWTWQPVPVSLSSLNGLTGATQTFSTGTTGTDFNIVSSGTNHAFNWPDASATARGPVTTGTQTFAGQKTFSTGILLTTVTNNIYLPTISSLSAITNTAFTFGGPSTVYGRVMMGGSTATTLGVGAASGNVLIGKSTVTSAASGTNPYHGSLVVTPSVKSGGAAPISIMANILSLGASTGGANNYNTYIDSGNVALVSTSGNVFVGGATSGNIGINQTAPLGPIHITRAPAYMVLESTSAYSSTSGSLIELMGSGTPSATNQRLGSLVYGAMPNSASLNPSAQIDGYSEGAWTMSSSQPTQLRFLTTNSGAASPTQKMVIQGNGNVGVNQASPTSTLHVTGSAAFAITTVSGNTTLDETYHTIRATASGITLTFPAASACTGRIYCIINYNTGGTVNTSAYLSPAAVSTTTISNQATLWVQSDGTNWYQIK